MQAVLLSCRDELFTVFGDFYIQTCTPSSGAQNIPPSSVIFITFNIAIHDSSVNTANFAVSSGGSQIVVTLSRSYDGRTVAIVPQGGLLENTQYTVNISGNVQSVDGKSLKSAFTWSFTTGDSAAPGEVTGLTAVSGNGMVMLTWNDPADADLKNIEITYLPGGSTPLDVAKGKQTANISGLTNGITYTFTVKTVDYTGNKTAGVTIAAKPDILVAQVAKTTTKLTGSDSHYFTSIAAGPDGSLYAAGVQNNIYRQFYGASVSAMGYHSAENVLLVKYKQVDVTDWAKTTESSTTGYSVFKGVSVSPDEKIYAVGYVEGKKVVDFGGGVMLSGDADSMQLAVIVKYDRDGGVVWAKGVGSSDAGEKSLFSGVVATDDGIYAVGVIHGNTILYDFGNSKTVLGKNNGENLVIVKYDINGNAQWVKSVYAGDTPSWYNSVCVMDEYVYACGLIGNNSITIDPGIVANAPGPKNAVLVRYRSNDGSAEWAKTVSSASTSSEFLSVCGYDNKLYVAGMIQSGTFDFGLGPVEGISSNENIIIAQYYIDGTIQWAKTTLAGGDSVFHAVWAGPDGVYAAGNAKGNASYTFAPSLSANASSYTDRNVLLVLFDFNGDAVAARFNELQSNMAGYNGITGLGDGSVFAAGYIVGEEVFDFGNSVIAKGENASSENPVLVKYRK